MNLRKDHQCSVVMHISMWYMAQVVYTAFVALILLLILLVLFSVDRLLVLPCCKMLVLHLREAWLCSWLFYSKVLYRWDSVIIIVYKSNRMAL